MPNVAVLVLVVAQHRDLRIGLAGVVRVHRADRTEHAETGLEVERVARHQVDGTDRAALDQLGFGRLAHHDLVDQLRRQQRVADAASHGAGLVEHEPVARSDVVAIDQRLREARAGAAHADAIVLVERALVGAGRADVHARHARQRVGNVLVRHLADVFRGDDLDAGHLVALGVQRLLDCAADAAHDDGVQVLGFLRGGRRLRDGGGFLCRCGSGKAERRDDTGR